MKTVAYKHAPVTTFCVDCGACGAELEHPATGSLTWGESGFADPESIVCHACGETNKVPRGFPRRKPTIKL